MAGVIRCRFDFDKMVAMRLAEQLGATPAETIVHAEDIRRPLAIHRDYPITTLTAAAHYYQGSDLVIPAKKQVAGLLLQASDGPFAAGAGPPASGRALALIMAMAGRVAYCDGLDGDGLAILRARCTTP
ncbi:MAG: hypothetical protein QOI36_687 [Pseudonocardiales bacterium]|nr:hypothetical protein [Pseudonocardiales bacterium]